MEPELVAMTLNTTLPPVAAVASTGSSRKPSWPGAGYTLIATAGDTRVRPESAAARALRRCAPGAGLVQNSVTGAATTEPINAPASKEATLDGATRNSGG